MMMMMSVVVVGVMMVIMMWCEVCVWVLWMREGVTVVWKWMMVM